MVGGAGSWEAGDTCAETTWSTLSGRQLMGPLETRGLRTWMKSSRWRMGKWHILREFTLSVFKPLFLKLHISLALFLLSLCTDFYYLMIFTLIPSFTLLSLFSYQNDITGKIKIINCI